jgi:hypothetical protein
MRPLVGRALALALIIACAGAGSLWAVVAVAQDDTGTAQSTPAQTAQTTTTTAAPPATTATTATTAAGETTADGTSTDASDNRWLAIGVLVFALAVVGVIVWYLVETEENYTELAKLSLQRVGVIPPARVITPFAAGVALDPGTPPGAQLTISGPGVLAVGETQAYAAKLGTEQAEVTWTATPDGLTIDPAQGATVQVTATRVDTYALQATGGDGTQPATVTVAVVKPAKDTGGGIPFAGSGYGAVIIAIVLIAVATVLGLLDVLDSTAIGTLLGAIAGYIFVRQGGGGGGGAGGAAPGGGAPGGGAG